MILKKAVCVLSLPLLILSAFASSSSFDEGMKAYYSRDYQKAYEILLPFAENGNPSAQHSVYIMYNLGLGVEKSIEKALNWLFKAAEQGDIESQISLSNHYLFALGVDLSYEKSFAWILKAAEQGDIRSQTTVGQRYSTGVGTEASSEQSLIWYRKAAEQGDVFSLSRVAYCYRMGYGVERDYEQAAAWYRKAAEQGHGDSQSRLAEQYEFGWGVEKDEQQAIAWYRKAAKQGSHFALRRLDKLNIPVCDGSTVLFGVALKCTDRDALMSAVKSAGAKVKSENKNKWGDVYETSSILRESSELYIGYTLNDNFARARYVFPSRMDKDQVTRIKNMVATKYGQPERTSGNSNLGAVYHHWQLDDGIEIRVSREWPDTTTYLFYVHTENYQEKKAALERQRKEEDAREIQAQSNAF